MSNLALTVIIPVLSLESPVAALSSLSHPAGIGSVEVLIAVGGCPARQRNAAAAQANADLLYFVDDDTWVTPETLKLMIDTLQRLDAVALGGPAVTHDRAGWFERCVGEVMASRICSGVVRARSTPVGQLRAVAGEELVSCNLLMRRSWFRRVGGLDEGLYPGEDVDLVKRLRACHAPMYYCPEARVERTRRRTVSGLSYQYYRYGQGRGLRFLKHVRAEDLVFLLPTALLFYFLLLPWLPAIGAYLYAGLAFLESVRICGGALLRALVCALLFPVIHLSYGWGMLVGLLGFEARSLGDLKGIQRRVLEL
jgi:GT2 family glycosyltransferase